MAGPTKKKLCWNCEGSVSLQEENCPYCGVYLSPSEEGGDGEEIEELFSPPYRFDTEQRLEEVPPSPFGKQEAAVEQVTPFQIAEEMKHTSDGLKQVIVPLSMLLSGTVFFLFGLALFLFSRQGVFILQWNGAFWYYYLLFGLVALMIGWRALSRIDERES
jgi:hypothetical protein